MDISSEDVLNAWLRLTTTVNNVRLAGELPYYELLICGILYRNQKSGAPGSLTATELCGETRMLKSQMNRTLNSMEKKGLIFRTRSAQDRRQVYITFNMEQAGVYEKEHARILSCVEELLDRVGRQRAGEIIQLFTLISDMADEVID